MLFHLRQSLNKSRSYLQKDSIYCPHGRAKRIRKLKTSLNKMADQTIFLCAKPKATWSKTTFLPGIAFFSDRRKESALMVLQLFAEALLESLLLAVAQA